MSSITELSKSELQVYEYIREQTQEGAVLLKESMEGIGLKLGYSEATVHRAVKKLKATGSVAIVAAGNKSEPNAIQYFGNNEVPDKISEEPFFEVLTELQGRADRFKNIVDTYQKKYDAILEENEILKEKIKNTSVIEYEEYRIKSSDIVGMTDIDENYVAFIIKKK